MTLNAAQVLLGSHDAQRSALVCAGEQLSHGALRDRVARCASAWRRRGVGLGDRVAIKLPDGSAWACAFLGTIWAGGVAVGVNPRIPQGEWEFVLGEAGFRFILAESLEGTPSAFHDRVLLLDEWLRDVAQATPIAAQAMNPEQPAFWTHSSGTTGRPKAIVHAHRSALHIERAGAERLGIHAGDRLFASSKLFFCYPLANSLLAGLKLGATVILDPSWPTAQNVVATIAAQRPTVFFSVPSMYRNLLNDGLAPQLVRHGVRLCVSAGEALPASLREAWRVQTGLTIANGFGASETLALVLIDTGGAQGLSPSPGVQIEAMNPHAEGAPTRIHIRAPTLALGYWQRPVAQAESFRDGGFCPADLFMHTDSQAWRFAGREDSLVKVHGRWVDLDALEERLAGCAGIAEAAVVSVPDDDGVGALALFYVARPDALPGAPGVSTALRAQADTWPRHQQPHWLHAVGSLPRTATGKLMRRSLVDLHRRLSLLHEPQP